MSSKDYRHSFTSFGDQQQNQMNWTPVDAQQTPNDALSGERYHRHQPNRQWSSGRGGFKNSSHK